jgi:protein TonB
MLWSPSPPPIARYGPSARSRATAFGLSLATTILLLWVMIQMGAFTPLGQKNGGKLVAIDLAPEGKAERTKAAQSKQQDMRQQKVVQTLPPPPTPPRVKVPNPDAPKLPPDFIPMTHDQYAATDISKMARQAGGSAGAGSGTGNSGSAYGPGEGPGGAKLYNAEWYREPSDAEISGYLPAGHVPGEWAMIACRTVEKFHVEDCQELGESPAGSGIARALRRASWQFLVRPPRIDGKPMIGAWVKIRFDFRPAKRSAQESLLGASQD